MCVLDPVNKNILDKTGYGFKDWFITDYVYKDFELIPLTWEETRVESLYSNN